MKKRRACICTSCLILLYNALNGIKKGWEGLWKLCKSCWPIEPVVSHGFTMFPQGRHVLCISKVMSGGVPILVQMSFLIQEFRFRHHHCMCIESLRQGLAFVLEGLP